MGAFMTLTLSILFPLLLTDVLIVINISMMCQYLLQTLPKSCSKVVENPIFPQIGMGALMTLTCRLTLICPFFPLLLTDVLFFINISVATSSLTKNLFQNRRKSNIFSTNRKGSFYDLDLQINITLSTLFPLLLTDVLFFINISVAMSISFVNLDKTLFQNRKNITFLP